MTETTEIIAVSGLCWIGDTLWRGPRYCGELFGSRGRKHGVRWRVYVLRGVQGTFLDSAFPSRDAAAAALEQAATTH